MELQENLEVWDSHEFYYDPITIYKGSEPQFKRMPLLSFQQRLLHDLHLKACMRKAYFSLNDKTMGFKDLYVKSTFSGTKKLLDDPFKGLHVRSTSTEKAILWRHLWMTPAKVYLG